MDSTINISIIGCGYWGPNLIRNLYSLHNCRVRHICDLDQARLDHLSSLYKGVQPTTNHHDIIRDEKTDAVVVATPARFHFELAQQALKAGKHVFIEKPMATSSEQCTKLIELAKRKGVTLMVGHTFLYSPAIKKIKEIVDSGKIGTVHYINARRLNLGLYQNDIDVTWDLAPHDISIILYLMGERPISLNSAGSSHISTKVNDVSTLCLQFKQQRSAFVNCSWLDPRKVREMTIVGSKAMIVYDDLEPQEKIKIYDTRVERPPHYDTFAEFQFAYHYGDKYIPYLKQEEPLKNEMTHFLRCIQTGESPLTDGQSGRDVVRVLEAASESAESKGERVFLDF